MVKSLLYQILDGIHYLHANWVLHRDLVRGLGGKGRRGEEGERENIWVEGETRQQLMRDWKIVIRQRISQRHVKLSQPQCNDEVSHVLNVQIRFGAKEFLLSKIIHRM